MKVKFLIPEFDRERFSKIFSNDLKSCFVKPNDLSNIGMEKNLIESIYMYMEGKKFPTLDRFLTLCHFFGRLPENYLPAIPKWIECEIDDISKFSVLGKINQTYYLAPHDACNKFHKRNISYNSKEKVVIEKELFEEPDPLFFSDFQLFVISTHKREHRLPCINIEKTDLHIENLLNSYGLNSVNILTQLLEYPQPESVRRLLKNKQHWAGKSPDNIFKLTWILDIPFEDLLEIDYHQSDEASLKKCAVDNLDDSIPFDLFTYVTHYVPKENEEWDAP